jgi:hypothetical protein
MAWIRRHWLALLGLAPLLPPLIKGIVSLIGYGGSVDFVISRIQEPAWVGDIIRFVVDPPGWSILPLIAFGLVLIYWDLRWRKTQTPTVAVGRGTSSERSRQTIPPSALPPRDVTLTDAMWRAFTGRWNGRPQAKMDIGSDPEALRFFGICDEIRQHAFDGKLPVWAARRNGPQDGIRVCTSRFHGNSGAIVESKSGM